MNNWDPMATAGFYYVSPQGETRGPATIAALTALLRAHAPDVSEETPVWRDGMKDWIPLGSVVEEQGEDVGAVGTSSGVVDGLSNQAFVQEEEEDEVDGEEPDVGAVSRSKNNKKKKKRKAQAKNTAVYVTGLPKNITEEEVVQFFARCGLLKLDHNNKPRVKVYRDHDTNEPKGDALITYMAPESVFLAIQRYDEAEFRDGYVLSVKEAEFSSTTAQTAQQESSAKQQDDAGNIPQQQQQRGSQADEKSLRAKKVKRMQTRAMLSWNDDSFTPKEAAMLIVVLKGLFEPEQLAQGGDTAYAELEQDLIEGLAPICPNGDEIKKITVFKSHPEAVILIRFKDALTAGECVQLMNGRFFDGRKIQAALWDGVTEYAPHEDVEARLNEQEKRMRAYDEWLENEDNGGAKDDS